MKYLKIGAIIAFVIVALVLSRGLYRRNKGATYGLYQEGELIDDASINYYSVSKNVIDTFVLPVWANQDKIEALATYLNSLSENQLKNLYNSYITLYNQDVFSVIKSRLCIGCNSFSELKQKIDNIKRPLK